MPPMDAFHILSKGGTRFDRKRVDSDLRLFSLRANTTNHVKAQDNNRLPPELDFFKGAEVANPVAAASEQVEGPNPRGSSPPMLSQFQRGQKRKRGETSQGSSQPWTTGQRIRCDGEDIPEGFTTFRELTVKYSVPREIVRAIEEAGYSLPTGIQSRGAPVLLERRDLAAIAPTGSGKTLAYLLPLFCLLRCPARLSSSGSQGARALIICPTRELAQQISNEALKLAQGRKWKVVVLTKATGNALKAKEAQCKVDILISTPLSLVSALRDGLIELDCVQHLIMDEADRLLEEGFLGQIEEVMASCLHPHLQKAVFSATLPAAVEAIAKTFLRRPVRVIVGLKDSATDFVQQALEFCGSEFGKLHALRNLISEGINPPILIFVQSIERATELFHELLYDGINVDVIHSERTKAQREDTVRRFRHGEVWVLVATELMARGMDFKGVNLVLNYDFPQTVQSYIHRIGRTGRAGRAGRAITYFTKEDAPYLKSVANVIKASGQEVPQYMLDLPKPSKLKKKQLKRKPVERKDISRVAGAGIGRNSAIKKRDMIRASKLRKLRNGDRGNSDLIEGKTVGTHI